MNWANDPQVVSYPQICWLGAARGSRPCTSTSSYEAWLQWITTSSPGSHLVTPSPTFQTTPEASEPPM